MDSNPQKPSGSSQKSRIYKKFVEKFQGMMDLSWNDETNEFINVNTRFAYATFTSGWMSHPCFSVRSVAIVGKITDEGIEFAAKPRLHVGLNRANAEAIRLEKKHGAKFKVFIAKDGTSDLTTLAIKSYEKLNKTRPVEQQEPQ